MKLIAWDTSAKAAALVALEWDAKPRSPNAERYRIASEWTLNVDAAQHSERLLWGVHQVLESCNWKLEDIDYFGVGVGPGSFTGLRIGVTTARTLAHTLGKKLVGVSSLAALARPAALHFSSETKRTVVIATTDAAKGELFTLLGASRSLLDCAAYSDGNHPGLWKRGVEECVATPEEIVRMAKKKITEGGRKAAWVRVGEGRNRYPELWKALPESLEVECPIPGIHQVQGRFLGMLVWEAIQAGLERKALEVHPRYVRASDPEKKLKAGLLKPAPRSSDDGGES